MGGSSSSGSAGRPSGKPDFIDFASRQAFADSIRGSNPGFPIYTSESQLPPVRDGMVRIYHTTGVQAVDGIKQKGILPTSELTGSGQSVVNVSTKEPWGTGITYVADVPRSSLTFVNNDWADLPKVPKSAIRGIWLNKIRMTSSQVMASMDAYRRKFGP